MATKFYFTPSSAPSIAVGVGTDTNLALFNTAPASGGATSITATAITGPASIQFASGTPRTWWIKTNGSVTISGTITLNLYGFESASTVNAGFKVIVDAYNASGGYIGNVITSTFGTELGTSVAVNTWTATPTSTVLAADDYLAVKVYIIDTGGTMAAGTATFKYNDTSGNTGDSWIQFNEAITPKLDPSPAASSGTNVVRDSVRTITTAHPTSSQASATASTFNVTAGNVISMPLATATTAKMYVATVSTSVNVTPPYPARANGLMFWDGNIYMSPSPGTAIAQMYIPEVRDRLWVATATISATPTRLSSGTVNLTAGTSMSVLGKATAKGIVNLTALTGMALGNLNLKQSPATISSEMEAITQKVVPRLTVEWATSRFMDNLVLTATGDGTMSTDVPCANSYFIPMQAANGWNESTFKWAVADALASDGNIIRCDEEYVTMDSLEDEKALLEMGWWSKSISGGAGTFGTSQVLQFEFDTRKANYLRVTSSDIYGPINQYKIYYKNTSNTWVQFGATQTLSGYRAEHDLGSVIDIKGIKIEVLSTKYGSDVARIQELEPVYRGEIDANDVVSAGIRKVKEVYDTTVPMGALAANTLDITLDNTALTYNTISGNLAPYLTKDVRITFDLGWDTGTEILYVRQGTFYTEDVWQEDGDNMTVSVSCRDFSKFCQEGDQLEYGYLLVDQTASKAIKYLALIANVPAKNILLHSVGNQFKYLFDKDVSIWNAMQNVATADIGLFYFDEYENLCYYTQEDIYNNVSTIAHTLSDDVNIIGGNVSNNLQANKIVIKIQQATTDNIGLQEVWHAPSDFIMATTSLSGSITDTSISLTSTSGDAMDFATSGFLKLDNEIIKYTSRTGDTFDGLVRGCFGTTPSSHSGVVIRECRELKIDFDTAPVYRVDQPNINQAEFFGTIDIDRYDRTAYSADLIISVSPTVPSDTLVVLEGEQNEIDPETGQQISINFLFDIDGIPISMPEAKDKVTEETQLNNSAIRRYGKKELTIENPFIQDQAYARKVALFLLDKFENASQIINMAVLCIPNITMNDVVRITDYAQLAIINKDYFIIESNINYDGGLTHEIVLKEIT